MNVEDISSQISVIFGI